MLTVNVTPMMRTTLQVLVEHGSDGVGLDAEQIVLHAAGRLEERYVHGCLNRLVSNEWVIALTDTPRRYCPTIEGAKAHDILRKLP